MAHETQYEPQHCPGRDIESSHQDDSQRVDHTEEAIRAEQTLRRSWSTFQEELRAGKRGSAAFWGDCANKFRRVSLRENRNLSGHPGRRLHVNCDSFARSWYWVGNRRIENALRELIAAVGSHILPADWKGKSSDLFLFFLYLWLKQEMNGAGIFAEGKESGECGIVMDVSTNCEDFCRWSSAEVSDANPGEDPADRSPRADGSATLSSSEAGRRKQVEDLIERCASRGFKAYGQDVRRVANHESEADYHRWLKSGQSDSDFQRVFKLDIDRFIEVAKAKKREEAISKRKT